MDKENLAERDGYIIDIIVGKRGGGAGGGRGDTHAGYCLLVPHRSGQRPYNVSLEQQNMEYILRIADKGIMPEDFFLLLFIKTLNIGPRSRCFLDSEIFAKPLLPFLLFSYLYQ
jgi:hypothetical protein